MVGLVFPHGGQTNFTPMSGDFSHVTQHTSSLSACGASTVSILLVNMDNVQNIHKLILTNLCSVVFIQRSLFFLFLIEEFSGHLGSLLNFRTSLIQIHLNSRTHSLTHPHPSPSFFSGLRIEPRALWMLGNLSAKRLDLQSVILASLEAGEKAQRLGVLAALIEDLSFVPSMYVSHFTV